MKKLQIVRNVIQRAAEITAYIMFTLCCLALVIMCIEVKYVVKHSELMVYVFLSCIGLFVIYNIVDIVAVWLMNRKMKSGIMAVVLLAMFVTSCQPLRTLGDNACSRHHGRSNKP
jgi:amino acid permease